MCENETYDDWCRQNSEAVAARKAADKARKSAAAQAIPPVTRAMMADEPMVVLQKNGFVSARKDTIRKLKNLNCHYCGRPLVIHGRTKDHVIPKSRGGRETVDACPRCNFWKGNLSLEEFRLILAFRMGKIRGARHEFPFWFEDKENFGKEGRDLP